jgi:hypothetical protein
VLISEIATIVDDNIDSLRAAQFIVSAPVHPFGFGSPTKKFTSCLCASLAESNLDSE